MPIQSALLAPRNERRRQPQSVVRDSREHSSSFEDPTGLVACDGVFPAACRFSSVAPTGWTSNSHANAGWAGTFQPGSAPGPAFNTLAGRASVAFIKRPGSAPGGGNTIPNAMLSQIIGPASLPGTYTLSVDLGFRKDGLNFVGESDLMICKHVRPADLDSIEEHRNRRWRQRTGGL